MLLVLKTPSLYRLRLPLMLMKTTLKWRSSQAPSSLKQSLISRNSPMQRYNLTLQGGLIVQANHFQIADSLLTKMVPRHSNAPHQTHMKTVKAKKSKDCPDSLRLPTVPSALKKSHVTIEEIEDPDSLLPKTVPVQHMSVKN